MYIVRILLMDPDGMHWQSKHAAFYASVFGSDLLFLDLCKIMGNVSIFNQVAMDRHSRSRTCLAVASGTSGLFPI
jgi:hypothetical protein